MTRLLTVPRLGSRSLPLLTLRPDVALAARRGFRNSLLAFDIDQTLLRTDKTDPPIETSFTNRPILEMLVQFLERGVPIAIISGNDLAKQKDRIIPPLTRLLQSRRKTGLLQSFHFFANTGASRICFTPNGKENENAKITHSQKYGFSAGEENACKQLLKDVVSGFIWTETDVNKPRVETRRIGNPTSGPLIQVTVKPFHNQEEKEAALLNIRSRLASAGDWGQKFRALIAGKTSIDIARSDVTKATVLTQLMEELGIPAENTNAAELAAPIFYFGDEFTVKSDDEGHSIYGNDIPVLTVPNVIAFAVNGNQALVPAHDRLIPAGSGPQATLQILRYFSLISESLRTAPRGTSISFPPITVPVIETTSVTRPAAIGDVDFRQAAIFLRINTLLGDPSRKGVVAESVEASETAAESSVLAPIIKLLCAEVKIVLLSGADRKKQISTVVRTIYDKLPDQHKPRISNLTLYANAGATKTTFTASGKGLKVHANPGYYMAKRLPQKTSKALENIVKSVMKEYDQRQQQLAAGGDREAQQYLAEKRYFTNQVGRRSADAQISINYIMPSQRSWLINKLQASLEKEKLQESYRLRAGGVRHIDINSAAATKPAVIEDFRRTTSIKDLFYFGVEFFLRIEPDGSIQPGNDMEVVGVPDTIMLGFNPDQDEVTSLRNPRIIAAGSGAEAAFIWLDDLVSNLDKSWRSP